MTRLYRIHRHIAHAPGHALHLAYLVHQTLQNGIDTDMAWILFKLMKFTVKEAQIVVSHSLRD